MSRPDATRTLRIMAALAEHGPLTTVQMADLMPDIPKTKLADSLCVLTQRTQRNPEPRVIRIGSVLLQCDDGQYRQHSVYKLQSTHGAVLAPAPQPGDVWESEQQRRYVGQSPSVWDYAQRVAG